MDAIISLFDINNTLFTLWGYPMSYLEFFGTLLNILSVYLVTRHNIWTWPIGNVAVILFAVLFYQIQLYADLVEQLYFLVTGFYGWWAWATIRGKKAEKTAEKNRAISFNSTQSNAVYLVVIFLATICAGYFTGHIHEYLPHFFAMPASFPYLDAFTTVMSFAATILMIQKKIECWYLWILVDIIGIGLYFAKGVIFVSMLYVVFLVMASYGLINWRKLVRQTL